MFISLGTGDDAILMNLSQAFHVRTIAEEHAIVFTSIAGSEMKMTYDTEQYLTAVQDISHIISRFNLAHAGDDNVDQTKS